MIGFLRSCRKDFVKFNIRLWFLIPVIMLTVACAQYGGVRSERGAPRYSADFGGVYHTVEKGQTLWRIAKAYGVELETLQWVNGIEDVTAIPVGRRLFIPGARRVLHVEPYHPGLLKPPSPGVVRIAWPLTATISSGFGLRNGKKHQGIDLPAPVGTPVRAAADGKVVYSGHGMRGYGNVVVLKHADEVSTVYAHNSVILVRMGDRVKKGQIISRVGKTGWATGPHLHFEVRVRGVPENPMAYLPRT